MNRHFKALVSLALCLTLICTLALSAGADSENLLDKLNAQTKEMEKAVGTTESKSGGLIATEESTVKWQEGRWVERDKPSVDDILATGDEIYIKMPHESYYLDEYEYKYVNDRENRLSVYVFDNPDNGTQAKFPRPRAYHGSRVVVLAVRGVHSCVLYWTENNVMHAGWISSENLQDSFPGDEYSVEKKNAEVYDKGVASFVPALKWSEKPIADTLTKYTIINNEGKACISMTLDYHVIGRNGVAKYYGEREVYCFADGEWIKAGEFEVNKGTSPVQFTIHFKTPVNVEAFLIIPKDLQTQGIEFRQSVVEMYYPED